MRRLVALLAVLCLAGGAEVRAQGQQVQAQGAAAPKSWTETKCERYRAAWSEALKRRGSKGIGPDFLARHEAFLASGCTAASAVCPRSAEELDLANVLTIAAMNAGTASTFLPFACR